MQGLWGRVDVLTFPSACLLPLAARYRMAIRIDDQHAEAHAALGELLWGEGDAKEAEVELRKALTIDPDNTVALLVIGHVL